MKYLLAILFIFLSFALSQAQSNSDKIYKSWVLSKVTYKDGTELPDGNSLKYAYIKYIFGYPDQFSSSTAFYERGTQRSFELKDGFLLLKAPEGPVVNTQRIETIDDKLVLLQAGRDGYNDPASLLFTFIPEEIYQKQINLKSTDLISVYNGDTTYVESPKIYADFKEDSFQKYIYDGIAQHINMSNRVAHFVASFIVSKTGIADSLNFLENIDAEFDKRFVKVFTKARKDWKPAVLNGKFVNVKMMVDLRYSTSATTIPAYFAAQKALVAFNDKHYEVAEYFYDKAIETEPQDKQSIYQRGMCKYLLGNKSGACEDWKKAKNLGSNTTIETVMTKFCN